MIAVVGKFVGIDLVFKFKLWGVVKLVSNLNKVVLFIGVVFEVWDFWKES